MTLLERMARNDDACPKCLGRGAIWSDDNPPVRCPPDPDGCGGTGKALAVLREEQASDKARMVTVIRALCDGPTLPDEVEDGKAAMGRVKAALAPPPPCATCGGETLVGEPGQRVNCPDCTGGPR